MPSILETIINPSEAAGVSSIDEIMAFSSINAAAGSAAAYLTATLEATTPEVRRLFQEYLDQTLMAQETLSGLAVKRGWLNPYESPQDQLKMAYQDAKKVLGKQNQQ